MDHYKFLPEKFRSPKAGRSLAALAVTATLVGGAVAVIEGGGNDAPPQSTPNVPTATDPVGPDGGIQAPPNPTAPNAPETPNPVGPDAGVQAPPNPTAP